MSTRSASPPSRSARKGRSGKQSRARAKQARALRARALRRRLMLLLGVAVAAVAVAAAVSPLLDKAVQEIALPLRHEDIIRQQAADKGVDASLIAAVIHTESRFRDQTSPAGAKGLMQIMPATADYIADLSGGTKFEQGDLASPQINIAYGSFYLNYLLEKYRGSEEIALAAYNAGEGEVDEWLAGAASSGETFDRGEHIPFPETEEYVNKVLSARKQYRQQYARELGL